MKKFLVFLCAVTLIFGIIGCKESKSSTSSNLFASSSDTETIGGDVEEPIEDAIPTPEPATMLLLGSGLVGLAGFRRKFKK